MPPARVLGLDLRADDHVSDDLHVPGRLARPLDREHHRGSLRTPDVGEDVVERPAVVRDAVDRGDRVARLEAGPLGRRVLDRGDDDHPALRPQVPTGRAGSGRIDGADGGADALELAGDPLQALLELIGGEIRGVGVVEGADHALDRALHEGLPIDLAPRVALGHRPIRVPERLEQLGLVGRRAGSERHLPAEAPAGEEQHAASENRHQGGGHDRGPGATRRPDRDGRPWTGGRGRVGSGSNRFARHDTRRRGRGLIGRGGGGVEGHGGDLERVRRTGGQRTAGAPRLRRTEVGRGAATGSGTCERTPTTPGRRDPGPSRAPVPPSPGRPSPAAGGAR